MTRQANFWTARGTAARENKIRESMGGDAQPIRRPSDATRLATRATADARRRTVEPAKIPGIAARVADGTRAGRTEETAMAPWMSNELRKIAYGSDRVLELLRAVGIEHVALNPGATFRGLHDSLVNYAGAPELVLTTHEEIAVALAHGYAKARGAPMAAVVHDIVGLQHASMAIFNAFCDRVPVLVLGGTGPMDTARRRPWIDWIHTALVQGSQVRDYVKLDDQPASVAAIPEAFLRAWRLARTEPQGPVYLCLDAGLQEEAVERATAMPDVARFEPASPPHADPRAIEEAAARLIAARFPVIVTEFLGRRAEATSPLCQLAEILAAPMVDLSAEYSGRPSVPGAHPLDMS